MLKSAQHKHAAPCVWVLGKTAKELLPGDIAQRAAPKCHHQHMYSCAFINRAYSKPQARRQSRCSACQAHCSGHKKAQHTEPTCTAYRHAFQTPAAAFTAIVDAPMPLINTCTQAQENPTQSPAMPQSKYVWLLGCWAAGLAGDAVQKLPHNT
jgi:hypothetical protein